MSYKTVIVDDEAPARRRVKMLLKSFDHLNLVAECKSGKEAIKVLNTEKPDLVFLDIQLGDMHGFDVLKKLTDKRPVVIFITAYDEFAIKAFNHFAFDFILKPFSNDRFKNSVNKVSEYLSSRASSFDEKISELLEFLKEKETAVRQGEKYLHVRKENRIILVKIPEVRYLKASGNYCELFLEKKFLIREAIGSLEKKLPDEDFVRIHRSTIVNVNFVEEVVHSEYGEIDVKINNGVLLRISRSYQEVFLKKVGLR